MTRVNNCFMFVLVAVWKHNIITFIKCIKNPQRKILNTTVAMTIIVMETENVVLVARLQRLVLQVHVVVPVTLTFLHPSVSI